jgi:hypothetical protein
VGRVIPPHIETFYATFLVVSDHGPAMGPGGEEGIALFNVVSWQCFPTLVTREERRQVIVWVPVGVGAALPAHLLRAVPCHIAAECQS